MSRSDSSSYRTCQLYFLTVSIFLILLIFPKISSGEPAPVQSSIEVEWLKLMDMPGHPAPNPRLDLRPTGKDSDWQPMIDAVWGPGFSAVEQTNIFQNFLTTLDHEFACFTNHDVDIVGLSSPYLEELNSGVSKGRFQAMMNQVCMALQNGHTNFIDTEVYLTDLEPGVPLLVGHRYGDNSHFGACLTTGDSGIFVYDVADDHPLGLEVGDVILGYDGRPWTELYQELLDAELPVGWGGWLTSDASFQYGWEISAGNNWHLFETIDIRKFSSGEVEHLPTNLMVGAAVDLSVYCSDQLNDEIPRPTGPDWATWGVLAVGDKRVGFIWCDRWTDEVEAAWGQACLDMVNDPDLDGLIIDFRNNTGGNMYLSNEGLSHLFNQTVLTVDFGYRINPFSHTAMVRFGAGPSYAIPGDPLDYFDKPIAVLLGPKAISSGDQVAFRMTYHPLARTFGRPTSATFDSPVSYPVSQHDEFWVRYSKYDSGRVETPQAYLSSVGFPVDQEVWLEPEDCLNGVDTVIKAALDWIVPVASPVPDGARGKGSRLTGASPNPANPRTAIQFQIEKAGPCRLEIIDLAGHLVRSEHWSNLETGSHEFIWDGALNSGRSAASSTYLVRLVAVDGEDRTRITLVK